MQIVHQPRDCQRVAASLLMSSPIFPLEKAPGSERNLWGPKFCCSPKVQQNSLMHLTSNKTRTDQGMGDTDLVSSDDLGLTGWVRAGPDHQGRLSGRYCDRPQGLQLAPVSPEGISPKSNQKFKKKSYSILKVQCKEGKLCSKT